MKYNIEFKFIQLIESYDFCFHIYFEFSIRNLIRCILIQSHKVSFTLNHMVYAGICNHKSDHISDNIKKDRKNIDKLQKGR